MIDEHIIRKVADLARVDLDESELKQFLPQLKSILDYFEALNEVDTAKVKPSFCALDIKGPVRDDKVCPPLPQHEIMSNTVHGKEGFYVVPKVIE